MIRPALFVAGAHTDVGKTHVACALLRAARARGLSAAAFKPVVSGFDAADPAASDPGRLLAALGEPAEPGRLDRVSPLRFAAPLAPPLAARREGVRLELASLAEMTRAWLAAEPAADLRLVEGAGGLMSPIAEAATGLDLMAALGLPSLLVGGGYLGGISHLLTALEVLRARGLPPAAVVVSQAAEPDAPDFGETLELVLEHAGAVPVIAAPRGGAEADWSGPLLDRVLAISDFGVEECRSRSS